MIEQWRKSSHSGGVNDSTCVEVTGLPSTVGVRDSKNPDGDRLTVTGATFGRLLEQIKQDRLDRP